MLRLTARTVAIAWLSLVAIVPATHAQRRASPTQPPMTREHVDTLKAELDELRQRTVEIPTLSAAVQELSSRLAHLAQQIDRADRAQEAMPHALGRLDGMEDDLRALAVDIEALRTRLADLEQPWARPSSDGVRYQDGFSWSTDEGRYALRLGGHVQGQYRLTVADGALEASTLGLRRARLELAGHVGSPRTRYTLLLSAIEPIAALDAFVDHEIASGLVVRFGQYKTPFTRGFLTDGTHLVFVDRPLSVESLRYDRDVQVGVHGLVAGERVGYYAGIGNGAGPSALNDNLDINVTVRADAVVLGERFGYGDVDRGRAPALMVGAGLIHDLVRMPAVISGMAVNNDVDADGVIDDVRVLSASFDAVLRYRGLEAMIEAVLRHEDFGTILDHADNAWLLSAAGGSRTYLGVVGQLSYVLPRSVLVAARAGQTRLPFLGVGGQESALPRGERALELGGVAQLLGADGYRRLGLQYSVQRFTAAAGAPLLIHDLVVEAQLRF